MDKPEYENLFGKLVIIAIILFFALHYHYQLTDALLSRWKAWWSGFDAFIKSWWNYDNGPPAGLIAALMDILFDIIKFIVYVIVMILSALLVLIFASLAYLLGILNKYYILPSLLPFFIIYSKFSYSFLVKPLISTLMLFYFLLKGLFKAASSMINFFILVPMAELITRPKRGSAINILYLSFFIGGSVLIVIGGLGVLTKSFKGERLSQRISSAFSFISRQPPEPLIQKYENVKVEGKHPFWTETDITVQPDDRIFFSAKGEVGSPQQWRYVCGPQGSWAVPNEYRNTLGRAGISTRYFLMPDRPIGALIGKIGTGEPFYIGESAEITAPTEGKLFLGINDIWLSEVWPDNGGYFAVDITITRR